MNTSYWETKRKQLALVKEQYASNGRKPIIVDSIIRAEVSMSANQQNFVFNLGETNGGTTFNTETRLALNDGFSIFEVGVFVAKPSSSTASNFKLYTYPNAGVFSTSNVATSLDGFFNNGSLNVQKDQVNYLQNFPLLFNRFVPEIQDGLTFGYTTAASTSPNGLDAFDGNSDGFTPLAAYINITGRDSLNVNIQIPTGLAAVESNQRAILIFKGYKAYNVAR